MSSAESSLPKSLKDLKKVGVWEGISYILLLFVAMPLKYFADLPQAVRIIGSLHGLLFVLFTIMIVLAMSDRALNIKGAVLAFIASLLPFGTFYLDKIVFKDQAPKK